MNFLPNAAPHSDEVIAAAALLAKWYAAHSTVRRLWAIEQSDFIHIILALEPTVDGSDMHPTWLAHSAIWTRELQLRMRKHVHLELLGEIAHLESVFGRDGVLITDQAWRDSTLWTD